jgi:hypothetical protein
MVAVVGEPRSRPTTALTDGPSFRDLSPPGHADRYERRKSDEGGTIRWHRQWDAGAENHRTRLRERTVLVRLPGRLALRSEGAAGGGLANAS